jgi:hypothetical protein
MMAIVPSDTPRFSAALACTLAATDGHKKPIKNNATKTRMNQTIGVASKRMNMPDRICRLETRLIARGNPSSNGKIICAGNVKREHEAEGETRAEQ